MKLFCITGKTVRKKVSILSIFLFSLKICIIGISTQVKTSIILYGYTLTLLIPQNLNWPLLYHHKHIKLVFSSFPFMLAVFNPGLL